MNRDLRLLWMAIACLSIGAGISAACNYNFITEVIKIEPEQLGYAEAIRETPGFLCVFLVALLMHWSEPRLASLGISVMAIGTGAYAWVNNVPTLIVWSFVASAGFHVWQALQSSMVLGLAEQGNKGKRMGQTACVASTGTICGILLVRIIGYNLQFPAWFMLSGAWMLMGSVMMFFLRRDIGHAEKPRLVWKSRYKTYYWLTLLEGGRKQVFITFAIYALTKEFKVALPVIATLALVNTTINILGAPIVGRLIDRIGERKIMLFSYTSLIFVFIGYASAPQVWMLYVLYTLDNLLFLSSTCLSTYLQKIADPEDMTPTLSMGVSVNHTAAVLVPLVGGYLWSGFGYGATFYGGAALVAISALLALRVPVHKPVAKAAAEVA